MASLSLHPDRLEIVLSAAERTLSLRRDPVVIRRDEIRNALITDDPWIWLRGVRAPGTAVPKTLAVGRWTHKSGSDFVVVKGRRRAIVLELDGAEFRRVVLSTKHAGELLAALRLDAEVPADFTPRRITG